MYRSFSIKNFRGFRDLRLESLERVNLIAGQNNVGKTALLEALSLHLRPDDLELRPRFPHLSLRDFNLQRRPGGRYADSDYSRSLEEIWGSLFFNYEMEFPITLQGLDNDRPERILFITTSGHALTFECQIASDQTVISRLVVTEEDMWVERPLPLKNPPSAFLDTRLRSPIEDAAGFGRLELVGQQDQIVSTLKLLEPRLRRLAVILVTEYSVVHGDVGIGRLLPVPNMGEGMSRLLSIALAIANTENGVVLIDEVENGLHYSVMSKVWGAIAQAARASNTQIFATTHSWECIRAAHEAFSNSGIYDFRLHRLDRVDDDIRAVTFDQEMLDTALKTGLEVR